MGALTGGVHGNTIDLDAIASERFEGKRVRVVLEPVDEDVSLSAEEQRLCWSDFGRWLARSVRSETGMDSHRGARVPRPLDRHVPRDALV